MLDITNQTFDRWTARWPVGKSGRDTHWLCSCECGNLGHVRIGDLRYGSSRSCGCLKRELMLASKRRTTHGRTKTPEYRIWTSMKSRCSNPKDTSYKHYGARGIRVCLRWLGKGGFSNFLADMGERPNSELSLDRVNNYGNYEPSNCRWATNSEQIRNRRPIKMIEQFTDDVLIAECRRRGLTIRR